MPDATQFLKGFGLVNGSQMGNYVLKTATSTHEVVKRYHEYKYHIELVFIPDRRSGDVVTLYDILHNKIIQQPIIYGVRNPYQCKIDPPNEEDIIQYSDGTIIFKLLGHSYRV